MSGNPRPGKKETLISAKSNKPRKLPKEGTPLFWAGADLKNLGSILDPYFEARGFVRVDRPFTIAAYEGKIEGRTVTISCAARTRHQWITPDISYRRYAGISFEFMVSTPVKTRLNVSPLMRAAVDNIVTRLVVKVLGIIARSRQGLQEISEAVTGGSDLKVLAVDPEWAVDFLSDRPVRKILDELLPERDEDSLDPTNDWLLRFTPEAMALMVTPASENITEAAIERWLQAALDLAKYAERKPTTVITELTRHEIETKANPERAAIKATLIFLSIPALAAILLMAIFTTAFLIWGEKALIGPIIFMIFFMPYAMFLVFRRWFSIGKKKLAGKPKESMAKSKTAQPKTQTVERSGRTVNLADRAVSGEDEESITETSLATKTSPIKSVLKWTFGCLGFLLFVVPLVGFLLIKKPWAGVAILIALPALGYWIKFRRKPEKKAQNNDENQAV